MREPMTDVAYENAPTLNYTQRADALVWKALDAQWYLWVSDYPPFDRVETVYPDLWEVGDLYGPFPSLEAAEIATRKHFPEAALGIDICLPTTAPPPKRRLREL